MEYPTLLADGQATLSHYIESLDRYSDEQFTAKPSEEEWSLGQMYEHLHQAYLYFFFANATRCLEKRKGQEGGEMNERGIAILQNNGFPPIKIKVPNEVKGPDPVAKDRSFYQKALGELVQKLPELVAKAEADGGRYKTQHPVFGWLNSREWIKHGELHGKHHQRQQRSLEEWLGIVSQS